MTFIWYSLRCVVYCYLLFVYVTVGCIIEVVWTVVNFQKWGKNIKRNLRNENILVNLDRHLKKKKENITKNIIKKEGERNVQKKLKVMFHQILMVSIITYQYGNYVFNIIYYIS